MELVVHEDKQSVARDAGARVAGFLRQNPSAHLGLATGATQQGIYEVLIEAHREGTLTLEDVRFFMLDEYVGVPAQSKTSFQNVLISDFLRHVNVTAEALEILNGNAPDLSAEALRFETALQSAGGVDMQLLGIGTNGHIGFNEPGSAFSSRTRVVDLHPETLHSNAHYFESPDHVPRQAISQGIETVMEARSILLLAIGVSKASAVASMVDGPVTPDCPASVLQHHPHVTIIVDRAAASMLRSHHERVSRASV